jgi:hypothetical protein
VRVVIAFFPSLEFVNRRAIPVKAFTRILCGALFGLSLLNLAGCGPDNEAEANKLAKASADPGAPNPKGVPEKPVTAPAGGYEAFARQSSDASKNVMKKGVYPGIKK